MKRGPVVVALALAACETAGPPEQDPPQLVYTDLSGAEVRPLDASGVAATVLIFITTDCPIGNTYSPELRAIVADHRDQPLRFCLVHVDPEVDRDTAIGHAREYDLPGPIVLDPEHRLVKHVGASVTPEAAVITAAGELAYRGRIDNWYGDLGRKRPQPTRRELRDALAAVLAGKPVAVPRTEAVGCYIPD